MVKYDQYQCVDFDIEKEMQDAQAKLTGHFVLSSGYHSSVYLQCAKLLENPSRSERVCAALAALIDQKIGSDNFDIIVSPAMGGIIVGYEVARQLGKDFIFCERVNGIFTLRRGFNIDPDKCRVVVIEDVITTGKSSLETYDCIEQCGGKIIGEGSIVNRHGGEIVLRGIKPISLLNLDIPKYSSDQLPEELTKIEITRPGSRSLSKQGI